MGVTAAQMAPTGTEVRKLIDQWKETSALLSKRDAIVKDLFNIVEGKAEQPDVANAHVIERLGHECNDLRRRLRELEKRHSAVQDTLTGDPFVVVLIDGELTLFNDSYVRLGAEGGRQAANHLSALLKQHLVMEDDPSNADLKIRPHIFGSASKLAGFYHAAGLVSDPALFQSFMKSFNKEHGFFLSMDSIELRESADRKVKRNFECFWNNLLCRYLVLGGGAKDRSYGDFLRKYTTTDEDIGRIIMLDRISFPKDMSTLAWKMTTIRSPSLFHNSNTVHSPEPDNTAKTIRLMPSDSPHSNSVNSAIDERHLSSKRIIHRASKQLLKRQSSTTPHSPSQEPACRPQHICFNRRGHRLDEQIRYDPRLRDQFRDRTPMLCFNYYLRKGCSDQQCADDHGEALSDPALETLRWMARLVPCRDAKCSDPACYFGHTCPHNGLCCQDICDFGAEMHDVDADVVERRLIVSSS